MLDRILVPLDGSETSEAVLEQVRRLLHHEDAEVILLRAVDVAAGADFDYPMTSGVPLEEAALYLQILEKKLKAEGARVRTIVEIGRPAEVILGVAERESASLIAMSTHGRSGIRRWVFGSVAEKIIRSRSSVPLLLVRAGTKGRELAIRRILVPIDGSDASRRVIEPTAALARLFDATVLVFHVEEDEADVRLLTAVLEEFRRAGVEGSALLRSGDPAEQILDACGSNGIDLVAMSTHGRSGLSRWALGSVTEKVLRTASVPILVIQGVGVPAEVRR